MQKKLSIWTLGLAIFTMLFGAGNVVFPLLIGKAVGNKVLFAIAGFIITAVIVPLLGLISAMLFEGNYKKYLATTGILTGALITLVCMVLIGLFAAPRCIALSYEIVTWYFPKCSKIIYSLIASILILTLTIRQSKVVTILGRYLGPLKLTLLFSIIILGIFSPIKPQATSFTSWESFLKGFLDGYFTMDILGTIFFCGLIYSTIKTQKSAGQVEGSSVNIALYGLKAGIIGGTLLGIVYIGFCLVAAMYGPYVTGASEPQLLSALASTILGPNAGILANLSVIVACFATALALTAVFADYLHKEILREKLNYTHALLITIITEFSITNLGFMGIIKVTAPILNLCYPALIALAISNIATAIYGFRHTKIVFFTTLFITAIVQYSDYIVALLKG